MSIATQPSSEDDAASRTNPAELLVAERSPGNFTGRAMSLKGPTSAQTDRSEIGPYLGAASAHADRSEIGPYLGA